MIVLLAPLANCDSSTPAAVQPLSNVQKVGPGADCPAGGVVITTGLDKNGDGVLNDAEVSQTATVCSGDSVTERAPAPGARRRAPRPCGLNPFAVRA